MGFITAIYENAKPVIASQVGVQEFKTEQDWQFSKYTAMLFNQVTWSIYSTNELSQRIQIILLGMDQVLYKLLVVIQSIMMTLQAVILTMQNCLPQQMAIDR